MPGTNDHLLIQHTPKAGGTTLRDLIFKDAAARGKTYQTCYNGKSCNKKLKGLATFDADHPSQVVMGHGANFRMMQPVAPGKTVRYTTIAWSPLSWTISL